MSTKIFISVIVPVYNVAEWVEECLDSIAGQTFPDFECIIIDDGSTDDSPAIADGYAARDPRFTVIHQDNRGLSGARNAGLEIAQGDYIAFVDSDDLIHPEMFEKLLRAIEEQGTRIAMCDLDYLIEGKHVSSHLLDGVGPSLLDEHRFWLLCCNNETISAVAMWNKLWRRDVFSRARFEEGRVSEDIIILSDIIPGNTPIALVEEPLYFYRMRAGSITSSKTRIADRLHTYGVNLDWDPYFEMQGWTDVRVANLRYIVSHLAALYESTGITSLDDTQCYAEVRRRVRRLFVRILPAVLARPSVAARVIPYMISEKLHGRLFDARAHLMGN